ncbi:UPF0175 family protein [Endozoicomonas euniceicola]|uniref:UPF0175 family protein n=1 Tax=Endozoicomonas euniceicola TaxID=1234143 RepID=A0ABY6GU49_9GAMM|nr:UPF0175 family protein [Endozoicomonas euniceicola]UYM16311.1 UPF0175 family protein [Endozoicomonas euniceicola]
MKLPETNHTTLTDDGKQSTNDPKSTELFLQAVNLFTEGSIPITTAARLAQCSLEEFIKATAPCDIDIVDYPPEDLVEELRHLE